MPKIKCITTTTCPNCPEVTKYLHSQVTVDAMEFVDETHPWFASQCEKYGATKAPTVIVFDNDDNELGRAHNVLDLKALLRKVL